MRALKVRMVMWWSDCALCAEEGRGRALGKAFGAFRRKALAMDEVEIVPRWNPAFALYAEVSGEELYLGQVAEEKNIMEFDYEAVHKALGMTESEVGSLLRRSR